MYVMKQLNSNLKITSSAVNPILSLNNANGKKNTIQNPDSFDIDGIFNEYIKNHNKKFELYLVKYDFELIFESDFSPHIKPQLENITTKFNSKKSFFYFALNSSVKDVITLLNGVILLLTRKNT